VSELSNQASSSRPGEPDHPRRIPLGRRLLFYSSPYILIALLLLGIEGGTRLFLPHISGLEVLIQPAALRPDLAEHIDESIFMGDPLLFWRIRPNVKQAIWNFTVVSTNGQGVRHAGDIGRKKPGSFRIVCLGDSVTFGYRVPLVFPEYPTGYDPALQPYALVMEKELREANPGKEIEVIPLAVPSYTTYHGLNWLRRDINYLKPDVVTACFGWNDIGERVQSDRQAMPNDWLRVNARRLMLHSQALTHLTRWRQTRKTATSAPAPHTTSRRVPQDEYVANLLEIARLAQSHGAKPLIIGGIYRDSVENPGEAALMKQYRDALRTAVQANGVPFVEIQALAEKNFPGNANAYGEAVHPNGYGHFLMANELLDYFAAHETIKPLNVPKKP